MSAAVSALRRVALCALALFALPLLSLHAQVEVRADVDAAIGGVTLFGGNYVDRSLLLARADLGFVLITAGPIAPLVGVGIESLGWDRGYKVDTACEPPAGGRCQPSVYLPSLTGISALAGVRVQSGARTAIRLAIGATRFSADDGTIRGSPVGSIEGELTLAEHMGVLAEARVERVPQLAGSSPTLASYTLGLTIK